MYLFFAFLRDILFRRTAFLPQELSLGLFFGLCHPVPSCRCLTLVGRCLGRLGAGRKHQILQTFPCDPEYRSVTFCGIAPQFLKKEYMNKSDMPSYKHIIPYFHEYISRNNAWNWRYVKSFKETVPSIYFRRCGQATVIKVFCADKPETR